MAIHAGSVEARDGDYFGPPLNRVARLLGIGHGGQVLLSGAAADLAAGSLPEDVRVIARAAPASRFGGDRTRLPAAGAESCAEFPALRSLEEFPNNLPIQLTRFVGRDQELVQLRSAVETTRLLALVGTGGVGKSRLALRPSTEVLNRLPMACGSSIFRSYVK